MTDFEICLSMIVEEISKNRHKIVHDYCYALLARFGGDEKETRDKLHRMVIHTKLDSMSCAESYWVTFDAKQSCGDWISFEDRDPPPEGDFLMYDGRNIYIGLMYEGFEEDYMYVHNRCGTGEVLRQDDDDYPTHWMPLPESPTMNEEDDE